MKEKERKGAVEMNSGALVIHGVMILLFVLLGVLFAKGKGAGLIAGYNTMPQWEKEQIDERKLCTYMARLMFLLAACWLVLTLGEAVDAQWLFWLGLVLFLAACFGGVIYMNTGNRIEK